MTLALELPLDDQDLARLRPMVDDLLSVAQRLRHYQQGDTERPDPSAGSRSS
jgi:hypothetical protein